MSVLRAVPDPASVPPPHNLEAEQLVIGAMMVSGRVRAQALSVLSVDDFYSTAHQRVFETIAGLEEAGLPSDPVSILDWMGIRQVEEIGGAAYLHTLVAGVGPPAAALHHAEIVLENARLRRLQTHLAHLQTAIRNGSPYLAIRGDAQASLEELDARHQGPSSAAPLDVDEFLTEDAPAYDWVIPRVLERADRVLITGPEGEGKSTLMRQIAIQVAAGIHPFTLEETSPMRVLLVDCENSRDQSRRALRPLRIQAGERLKPHQMYPIVRPEGLDLTETHDEQWLAGRVAAVEPDLLIIGPLYKMATGDPKDEEVARSVAGVLDRIRTAANCALIIEAHQPHPGGGHSVRPTRPYGASLWMRWPEFGLQIRAQGNLLHWRGARDERDWPPTLKRGGLWPWTVENRPAEQLWTKIVEHVTDLGYTPSERALENALGEPKSNIHRALNAHKEEWEHLQAELKIRGGE